MSFIIDYFELDVPEECTGKLSLLAVSGELNQYVTDLIIADLTRKPEEVESDTTAEVPAVATLVEPSSQLKELMKEALSEWLDSSPKALALTRGAGEPVRDEVKVIDVEVAKVETKPTAVNASKDSKGLLAKFSKMRKG